MAVYIRLCRSPFILRSSSTTTGISAQRCIQNLSNKYTPYVVYVSPPTSGYHTTTKKTRDSLLQTYKYSVFSTSSLHRNNSYLTSLLQKAFVVRAAEPLPDSLGETSAIFSDNAEKSASYSETVFESTTYADASTFVTESAAEAVVESSAVSDTTFDSISYIPPPPAPPEAVQEAISYIPLPPAPPEAVQGALNALGEPTIQSLGLGGWTPAGLIQNCLDFLHVTCDLPWWGAIAVATVCIRIIIFPLVLMAQRNAAKMNNNLPQLQLLQMKMTEARNSGNHMESARLAQEMVIFLKEKDVSPMKNMIVPLAQAPLFISMFVGLRGMANLPLESMKYGGMFWFTDLTLSDPYFLLPVITAATMLATIELGTDGARLENMQNMKWVLRGIPLIVFPFTMYFPTGVLCYWVSTNFFSLLQVGFLRIPSVREYFKIPKLINHHPDTLPQKKKGMVAGFKESWSNMKVTRELEERERYDDIRFKRAGIGPVVRTFKHDPTRKVINVQAKVKSTN